MRFVQRARARARCLRVESDDDFHQPRSSILCEKRNPRHTTPKRFSLIDFEGPRVVNSTGMHRNATLLNSSAMERLRSLSGPPLLPPTPLSPLPAVYTATTIALAPFPVPSPFPTPSRRAFPTFVLAHADVVQYLHTDR